MNQTPHLSEAEKKSEALKAICAEEFHDFHDAMSLLYIRGNRAARLKFYQDWPGAAAFILGGDLIKLDTEGSGEGASLRALEHSAENRRIRVLGVVETLLECSVVDSSLKLDYVQKVIADLGYDVAVLLYNEDILKRAGQS